MFKHFASLRHPRASLAAAAVAALAWSAAAFARGSDELWEVTMKMEMPGMPVAMPAQVHSVCVAKNRKDEDLIPRQGNCRVLESNRTGNKLIYRMACTGEEANVSGEMTYGSNSYEGRMRMTTRSAGESMEMQQTFAGRRVGDCTAAK